MTRVHKHHPSMPHSDPPSNNSQKSVTYGSRKWSQHPFDKFIEKISVFGKWIQTTFKSSVNKLKQKWNLRSHKPTIQNQEGKTNSVISRLSKIIEPKRMSLKPNTTQIEGTPKFEEIRAGNSASETLKPEELEMEMNNETPAAQTSESAISSEIPPPPPPPPPPNQQKASTFEEKMAARRQAMSDEDEVPRKPITKQIASPTDRLVPTAPPSTPSLTPTPPAPRELLNQIKEGKKLKHVDANEKEKAPGSTEPKTVLDALREKVQNLPPKEEESLLEKEEDDWK